MSKQDTQDNLMPREKMQRYGMHALSDRELIAVCLRTGCKGMPVLELANALLQQFGSLSGLICADVQAVQRVHGMGEIKALQFVAALELSKRYLKEEMKQTRVLDSSQAVRQYLHHSLKSEPYEQFWLIHLNNQHQVVCDEVLFKGTIDSAAVYPRVVIDSVIKNKSAAVIFAHNHPSGVAEPSQADISLTKRLKQALSLIDVRTLDHFVIGGNEVVSFAELGLL